MPEKMKAALLYGIRNLKLETIDIPEIGPGEILAKVRCALTCGTDLKIYLRGYAVPIKYPLPFGHEWAGDIVEVGEGVEKFKKGMRITSITGTPCFNCELCKDEKFNLCKNKEWLWGAYAEYIKIPARIVQYDTYEIPSHLTYEEAALTEPLASVIHGQNKLNIRFGDTVAIIGSGPIGLLHLQCTKLSGAGKIIVIDVVDKRLEIAEKFGAETINSTRENPVQRVKELTNGLGADIVIEAVGLPQTWELALKLVKKGGIVLMFGGCPPNTNIKVNTELLHYGEVTVLGSYHRNPHDNKKALDLLASGLIDAKSLITSKMNLEEIEKAFELLASTKEHIKIAIIP